MSIIELIFTFLPVMILLMIKIPTSKFNFSDMLIRSDFSFLAMILYSQTLIKLFSGLIVNKNEKDYGLLLIVSLVLAIGLIPSVVYLVLIETDNGNVAIYILQLIWLVGSIIIFWLFGRLGTLLSEKEIIFESDFEPSKG
ncbi:MAG: hypothetical protein P1P65_07675 [Treponema sp.]